jgi:SAM-dependent methyltransferase
LTVSILQSRAEIENARLELERRGLSCIGPRYARALRRLHVIRGVNVGDARKSWDVLKTVTFLESALPLDAPILDLGAFASEIPCILHRMHFSEVSGVDLNPRIRSMPYADMIGYRVGDFHRTPFAAGRFAAITAVSVIEHGFDSARLLVEVSRLLKPGGYFIASFDYWPNKIDTAGVRLFDLDWRIFSESEIRRFIADGGAYELAPHGEVRLGASQKVVEWAGRGYTFGWLVLRKEAHARSGMTATGVPSA